MKRSNFFLHNFYCEDVRNETGGKLSLMGIYQGMMQVVNPPPVLLPQLCFVLFLNIRKDIELSQAKVRIFFDGKLEQEIDIDVSDNKNHYNKIPYSDDLEYLTYVSIVKMVPFQVDSSCSISITAVLNEAEIEGIPLKVILNVPSSV